MKRVNLFIDRIYEDKIDLISDAFLNAFTAINYYKIDDKSNIISRNINNFEITLEKLTSGQYIIYFSNDEETSEEILIDFVNKTKNEYFKSVFDLDDKKQNAIIKNLKTSDYIEELYKAYIDNKNEEYTETYQLMLKALIEDYNNYSKYKNLVPYNLDIRFSNNHVLDIDFSRCIDLLNDGQYNLISGSSVYYDEDHKIPNKNFGYFMTYEEIKKEHHYYDLSEGLYKFYIIRNYIPCLSFYVLIPSKEEKELLFQQIVENKKKIEENKIDSRSILESEYDFESEEEKEIIMDIEFLIDKKALFSKPNLIYKNRNITFDSKVFNNFSKISNKELFLYGLESDSIYNNTSPHKIKIDQDIIKFNVDEKYFNKERYYFYVGDKNYNKLSKVSTIDLTEYNDNGIDYNEKYEHLILNTYIKNLYSVCGSHNKWGELKAALDRYNNREDIAFTDIFNELYTDLLLRLNYAHDKVEQLIYNIELVKLKNYTNKNRDFMKSQIYKSLYNTHVIPAGDYILEIKRINKNGKEVSSEYIYSPDKAQEVRIDTADFTILRCISHNDFSISDFTLYNNTGYGVKHFYNSLEVEVSNVL